MRRCIETPRFCTWKGLVCVALYCCGCAATGPTVPAQERSHADATAGTDATTESDPMVCQREAVPGHRMSRRVCRRQSEIRAQRDTTQTFLRQARPASPVAPEAGMGGR
jgi:hypothetical protein